MIKRGLTLWCVILAVEVLTKLVPKKVSKEVEAGGTVSIAQRQLICKIHRMRKTVPICLCSHRMGSDGFRTRGSTPSDLVDVPGDVQVPWDADVYPRRERAGRELFPFVKGEQMVDLIICSGIWNIPESVAEPLRLDGKLGEEL